MVNLLRRQHRGRFLAVDLINDIEVGELRRPLTYLHHLLLNLYLLGTALVFAGFGFALEKDERNVRARVFLILHHEYATRTVSRTLMLKPCIHLLHPLTASEWTPALA